MMKRQLQLRSAHRRTGITLIVVLAGMALILLMLGALARRVLIEHRALDAQAEAFQADWLAWSAVERTKQLGSSQIETKLHWLLDETGNSVSARVHSLAERSPSGAQQWQVELEWVTASGKKIERSQVIQLPKVNKKAPQ